MKNKNVVTNLKAACTYVLLQANQLLMTRPADAVCIVIDIAAFLVISLCILSRMGLESCGVRTPTTREQVILHRVRRIHVPTLKS